MNLFSLRPVTIFRLLFVLSYCLHLLSTANGELEKQGLPLQLTSRETNAIAFVRLLVKRLIYGLAAMVGLGDALEEFAGGALVPPGVDDDYGFGLGGSDNKDYDDDYKDDDLDYY